MKDLTCSPEGPFAAQGNIVEVLTNLSLWVAVCKVIDRVNSSAFTAKALRCGQQVIIQNN